MTDDVRKLLGGYATGTLSEEEKQVLFDAALQDDNLFAALADEHALKELLDDSAVRAQLLRATEDPRFTFAGALREWFERPKAKALVATAVVLLAIIGFNTSRQTVEEKPEQVAVVRKPPAATPEPPPKTAAPQTARRAAKPKPEQPPAPAPSGGVVGGIVGGVPSVSSLRYAQESSAAKAAPLGYELLKRNSTGEFTAVPSDTTFTEGDVIRIRVTAPQDGAVAIATAGQSTVSATVKAGESATLPVSGGITIGPGTRNLVLTFSSVERTNSVEIPIHHRAP